MNLGNLFGAVTNLTTAFSGQTSYKSFIQTVNDYGIQVKNNFEVNFSGLQTVTLFITDITLPGVHQNMTEVFYDGRQVDIPVNYEYDHDFSMTVLDDAQGYLYTAVSEFILSESTNVLANSGYTMTIKALTSDENYKGMLITCNGVRFESISGLDFSHSANDLQTFTIEGKLIDYSVTPGVLNTTSGIIGAIDNLIS